MTDIQIPAPYNLPVGYPDELWYSRLTRYHRRSGNQYNSATIHELGIPYVNARRKVPIYGTGYIMSQYYEKRNDEEGFWSAVRNNTLEPFFLRFYPVKKRLEYYELSRSSGRKKYISMINASNQAAPLRYCPLCFKEDMENYGESYWHRIHQIPAVTVCPKHLCRVFDGKTGIANVSTARFCCADEDTCPNLTPVPANDAPELPVIRCIQQVLESPFNPFEETNIDVIVEALLAQGYLKLSSQTGLFFVRGNTLKKEITDKFADYAKTFFPGREHSAQLYDMIISRHCCTAEKFCLLISYLKIPQDTLFQTKEDITSNVEQIRELSNMPNSGYLWNKKLAAKRLGMTSESMQRLAEAVNVSRFWGPDPSKKPERITCIRIPISLLQKINERVESMGVYSVEEYIRYATNLEETTNKI